MGFQQDVNNSYSVMMANLANAQMAVDAARRRSADMRTKDLQESHSQNSQIFGKFVVNGSGETRKVVNFPVAFSNAPLVLTTVEVQPEAEQVIWADVPANEVRYATQLAPGQAPLVQSNVVGWITQDNPPSESYYTGVEILTVCDGTRGVKYIVHWSAAGIAYMNPAAGGMDNNFRTAIQLGQLYGQGMA